MANYDFYLIQDRDKLIKECTVAKLFETSIAASKISSMHREGLLDFSNSITVTREDVSKPFECSLSNVPGDKDTFSFNIVLFLYQEKDEVSGSVINEILLAFTKFKSILTYKKNSILSLSTNFSYNSKNDVISYVTNITLDDKKKLGDNLFEYTSLEKINNVETKDFNYFSNYTSSVEDSIRNGSVIFNGLISSRFGYLNHLDFSTNFVMEDLDRKGFDYYWIATYRDDIALYAWRFNLENNIELRIVSLSRQNLFGQPALLTKKGGGFETINCSEYKPKSIRYCSGKYVVIECKNNQVIVFNIETGKALDDITDNFIIDCYDKSAKIVTNDITVNYPELNDLLNRVEFVGNIYLKCGPWVITKTDSNRLSCQSPYLTKIINKGANYFFINEQSLLVHDTNWTLYQGEDEYTFEDLTNIYKTELQFFKRNKLCVSGIKDIIASYKGLIYYIDKENKINLL